MMTQYSTKYWYFWVRTTYCDNIYTAKLICLFHFACVCEHVVGCLWWRIRFLSIILVFFICVPLLTQVPLISNTSTYCFVAGRFRHGGKACHSCYCTQHSLPSDSHFTCDFSVEYSTLLNQYQNCASLTWHVFCNSLWNSVFNTRIFLFILTTCALAFSTIW